MRTMRFPLHLQHFFFMRTVCTFFTLIEFFCSPIFVSLYGSAVNVMEFFVVRTHQITIFIYAEIHCSVWIIMVFNILDFFFIHGKFHVFSHSVFFTVQIVVEASIACVGNWIFRILSIYSVEFFHKRLEAIHIRGILLYVIYGDTPPQPQNFIVIWGGGALFFYPIFFFLNIKVSSSCFVKNLFFLYCHIFFFPLIFFFLKKNLKANNNIAVLSFLMSTSPDSRRRIKTAKLYILL